MPSTTIEYPVDRIIDEYDTDDEGLSDLIHSIFDDDFSCNHFAINIDIINEEIDGIYEAIYIYEETYGEFGEAKDMKRPHFYAWLAFVSLHDNVREEVERRIELNAEHAHQECSEEVDKCLKILTWKLTFVDFFSIKFLKSLMYYIHFQNNFCSLLYKS